MTRTKAYRSVGLAVLVVLSTAVGAVALTGPAAAQESGENATNATDGSFYGPSEDDPLNVRFRNCCGTTVDSVADGVLNLNVVYGLFDGAYDLDISASGLSDDEVDEIVFDDESSDATDLDRTDIVGMDFSGVPAGEYEFTVSVTDGDGEATVPIEVTGDEGTTNETNASAANETADESANESVSNETVSNETTANATDTSGNASIVANPATPGNESAYHNVSVVAGPEAEGNLSSVTVNYGDSNASIGLVGGNIASATLDGDQVVNNTTTSSIGVDGRNLTVGFDGTLDVEEGDRVTLNYTGVTNPTEAGEYTVGVGVNNESLQNTTLAVSENGSANATTGEGNASNASAANATNETSGNASIVASPSAAGNESAFHNVSVVAGPDSGGNLSAMTVNYGDSNASIGLVGGNIASATLDGDQVVNNTTTANIGVEDRNLTIGFDGTLDVEEGDRITLNYTGVTNPPESGDYTVGVAVNNGSFQNTTLAVTESSAGANGTTGAGATSAGTTAGATTDAGTAETTAMGGTSGDTATSGDAGTSGAGTSGDEQQGTEAGGPGFGVVVAVVALLAAALVAVRRR